MWMRATFALLALLGLAIGADAQTDIDISPFGGRLFPDVRPTVRTKALTKDTTYFISPLYLNTDGLWLGRLTGGVALTGLEAPTKISISYSHIAPDGDADSLNGYGASVTSNVWKGNNAGVTVLGAYSDTIDASVRAQVGATVEGTFAEDFSAGIDARWVHSSAGEGADALVPRLFAGYDWGVASVGADYTLDNDVDGESDYSAEVNVPFGNTVLAVGAGKNSTWYVYLVQRF